jgi:hypothetical protein
VNIIQKDGIALTVLSGSPILRVNLATTHGPSIELNDL